MAIESFNLNAAKTQGTPVMQADYPDPFATVVGSAVYVYSSNVTGAHVPVGMGSSGTTGDYLGDAMPNLASWTAPNAQVWAPSVWQGPNGTFVMYYAATEKSSGRMCVSRAVSTDPAGPFVDELGSALICPLSMGGAIDPSFTMVNGNLWLVYKVDGNCCQLPTSIWSQQLSSDGRSLVGSPTKLFQQDQAWEGSVVEAPSVQQQGGKIIVFYSGNDWDSPNYAIGYAVCDSITGPCIKPLTQAWHAATSDAVGVGGQEFIDFGGVTTIVYHGWLPGQVNPFVSERNLYFSVVTWNGATPTFVGYSN